MVSGREKQYCSAAFTDVVPNLHIWVVNNIIGSRVQFYDSRYSPAQNYYAFLVAVSELFFARAASFFHCPIVAISMGSWYYDSWGYCREICENYMVRYRRTYSLLTQETSHCWAEVALAPAGAHMLCQRVVICHALISYPHFLRFHHGKAGAPALVTGAILIEMERMLIAPDGTVPYLKALLRGAVMENWVQKTCRWSGLVTPMHPQLRRSGSPSGRVYAGCIH